MYFFYMIIVNKIMYQYWFINCNKCTTLVQDNNNEVHLRGGVLSAQFFCYKKEKSIQQASISLKGCIRLLELNRHLQDIQSIKAETHYFQVYMEGSPGQIIFQVTKQVSTNVR